MAEEEITRVGKEEEGEVKEASDLVAGAMDGAEMGGGGPHGASFPQLLL